MNKRWRLFYVLAVALSVLPVAVLGAATLEPWGAHAASSDRDLDVADMLRYALEDEYLARAEYAAIINSFGRINPFANIIAAEESHISWLLGAYSAARLAPPKDEAPARVSVPASVKAALEAGVAAEVDNIAMYDRFLATPIINAPANADLRSLFLRLRDASKKHLSAFETNLARL